MTRRADAAFALLIAMTAAWAVYEASGFPEDARLFPLAIALPTLVLALVQVPLSLRPSAPPVATDDGDIADELPDAERLRRTAQSVGWIVVFFAGVYLVGFEIAISGGALLYLRLGARERWPISLAVAALCFVLVSGVFGRALHVPLPPGELLRALGVG